MTRREPNSETVTLHVPFRMVKRGGRKEMQLPEGSAQPRGLDSTLVKALARAFRWKRMLDTGEFVSVAELAESEEIAPSYVTRILQLTLLPPDTIDAVLEGTLTPELTLAKALEAPPTEWKRQMRKSPMPAVSCRSTSRYDAMPHSMKLMLD